MSSDVDVCNLALANIAAEGRVASIVPPDRTVEAGQCATFFPIARRVMLVMSSFSFAKKRSTMALLPNDSTEWTYKYQTPSDCINTLKILTPSLQLPVTPVTFQTVYPPPSVIDYPERAVAYYDSESGAVYTNQALAVLVYTFDQTDIGTYPPDAVMALAALLSSYLCGPLIKGKTGAQLAMEWGKTAKTWIMAAAANDANNSKDVSTFTPGPIAARR